MLSEFRNAVSCKKSSRLRRRRPLSSSLALRHPARLSLGASRPLRLVREMRLSNGKLYSGAGPLTGSSGGAGGPSELGPGPQRLLEEPLGAKSTPAGPLGPPAVTVPLPRGCTHVRICQECRRIQSLRTTSCSRIPPSSAPLPRLAPPPPRSSSNTDSEGGGGPSPRRRGHSPPPRACALPPPQNTANTDLLGGQDWEKNRERDRGRRSGTDRLGTLCPDSSTCGSGWQNLEEGFEFSLESGPPTSPLCFVISGILILDVWKSL